MADLVPGPIRGRYFARRSQIGQFVGLLVTVAIGYVLDQATQRGEVVLLRTLAAALALAAASGVSDFLFFLPVGDRPSRQPNPRANLWEMLREPWRDRNFRRFAGWTATLTFATGFIPQFTWLYVLDVVGWSNTRANVMLVLMPLLTVMLFGPLWGRAVDRFGRKPVLLLAGLIILPGSIAWVFITPDTWLFGYALVVLATAAWPGIEIANFNMLLRMNAHQNSGAFVAVNSALVALAGILSGLFGGAIAEWLGGWHTRIAGWPVSYHAVLFAASTLLRFAAWLWLPGLQDTGTGDTRLALRFLGTNLYSNLQQAVFIPGRLLQQLSRWTFPLRPRRRSR